MTSPFNAIAIESCGAHLSCAAVRRNQTVKKIFLDAKWKHEEIFWKRFPALLRNAKLKLKDVDFFCVTRGPGRFTGVRLGLSVIRTWANALGKPVFAPTTLELMAWQLKKRDAGSTPRTVYLSAFSGAFIATREPGRVKPYLSLEEFFRKNRLPRLAYYAQPNLEESIRRQAIQAGFSVIERIIPQASELLAFAQALPKAKALWRKPPNLPLPLYLKKNWPFIS